MIWKYTEEQIDFIRKHAKNHTRAEVTKVFNQKFNTDLTINNMKSTMSNHKIKIGVRDTSKVKRLFTKEQEEFVIANYRGTPNRKLTERINEEFATNFTVRQISSWKKNHDLSSGLTGRFEKGHVPANKGTKGIFNVGGNATSFRKGNKPYNVMPVGTRILKGDDYWWTKVSDNPNKWRQTHRLIWEEVHGPLTKNQVLIFLDGDRNNLDIENLQAITKKEHIRMNQYEYRSSNPEITKVGIALTKTKLKLKERRDRNVSTIDGGGE